MESYMLYISTMFSSTGFWHSLHSKASWGSREEMMAWPGLAWWNLQYVYISLILVGVFRVKILLDKKLNYTLEGYNYRATELTMSN